MFGCLLVFVSGCSDSFRVCSDSFRVFLLGCALSTYCAWSMGSGSCRFCLVYFWIRLYLDTRAPCHFLHCEQIMGVICSCAMHSCVFCQAHGLLLCLFAMRSCCVMFIFLHMACIVMLGVRHSFCHICVWHVLSCLMSWICTIVFSLLFHSPHMLSLVTSSFTSLIILSVLYTVRFSPMRHGYRVICVWTQNWDTLLSPHLVQTPSYRFQSSQITMETTDNGRSISASAFDYIHWQVWDVFVQDYGNL